MSLYDRTSMPWCDGCARFLNPNTLHADGSCPSCEQKVAEPAAPASEATASASNTSQDTVTAADLGLGQLPASETEVPKAPWHFKLLVAAAVIYLLWRFVQMVAVAF